LLDDDRTNDRKSRKKNRKENGLDFGLIKIKNYKNMKYQQ
jgi:hypothetical protein